MLEISPYSRCNEISPYYDMAHTRRANLRDSHILWRHRFESSPTPWLLAEAGGGAARRGDILVSCSYPPTAYREAHGSEAWGAGHRLSQYARRGVGVHEVQDLGFSRLLRQQPLLRGFTNQF